MSSETPWTPGPWGAQHQPRLSIINGDNGEHIADTGCWRDDEHSEMRANARLIAAAPKLADELDKLVRALTPLERDGSLAVPGLATLNAARAALRAAGHPSYQE